MARTIQLDESKHAVALMRGLVKSQHEREHCDIVIKVGGLDCHAHKNILSVSSRFFKAMLKHGTKESNNGAVELNGVDFECVKSCINFMYTARIVIPEGNADDIFNAAITMQLDDMIEAICCTLEQSDLLKIIESKKLSEEAKLSISVTWVRSNPDRTETLLELIKLIKLDEISAEYLSGLLENHPVISNDIHLYKMLSAPLVKSAKAVTTKEKLATRQKCYDRKQIVFHDGETERLKSYDTVTCKVTKLRENNFGEPWLKSTVICMDSHIYLLCGKYVYGLNFKDKNSKWESMQDMITSHGPHPPSVAFQGSLFVIGGSQYSLYDNCDTSDNSVERFDPAVSQCWLTLNDKPNAISDAALVSLDDAIYCVGGHDGMSCTKSMCKFIPSTSEWVDLQPMVRARTKCAAAAIPQKIFAMGGEDEIQIHKVVECYDVTTGQWTRSTSQRGYHTLCDAHYLDGWIYVVDRGKTLNEAEKYDISNDKWHKVEFRDRHWKLYALLNVAGVIIAVLLLVTFDSISKTERR